MKQEYDYDEHYVSLYRSLNNVNKWLIFNFIG